MGVIKRFIIIVALIAALPGLLPAPRGARAEPPAPKPLPELDGVAVNPPSQPAAPGALTPRAYLPLVYNNPACQRYGLDCLEPNDSVAGGAALPALNRGLFGTVITGSGNTDNVDVFRVTLVAGVEYSITLSGGLTMGSPFTPPADLDLYLFAGSGGSALLSAATFGAASERLLFTPPATGEYALYIHLFAPVGLGVPYRLDVVEVANPCTEYGVDCREPNSPLASAAPLPWFNQPVYGVTISTTQVQDRDDFFAVLLQAGTRYTMTLSGGLSAGTPFTTPTDMDLYLYDGVTTGAALVAQSDTYGQAVEQIVFVAPTSTAHGLRVRVYAASAPLQPYRLEVRSQP